MVWLRLVLNLRSFCGSLSSIRVYRLGTLQLYPPLPLPCGPCLSHSFLFGVFSLIYEKDIFRGFVCEDYCLLENNPKEMGFTP